MNLSKIFNYEGNDVRTVIINKEPWFVAKDVCKILEISNNRDAIGRLDDDEKGVVLTDTLGGQQNLQTVNEPGLYSLVFSSRKKEAKAFKRWVTHEVLPSIRQTGGYNLPSYPDALRQLATNIEDKERLEKENTILLPKATMHDLFLTGKNAQPMNVAAKSLGIGRNKLFRFLRNKKVLMSNNTPYQSYIDRGYFEVIERPVVMSKDTINKPQTLVTAKGIDYIGKLLLDEGIVSIP